jgi:hypothetical protein
LLAFPEIEPLVVVFDADFAAGFGLSYLNSEEMTPNSD